MTATTTRSPVLGHVGTLNFRGLAFLVLVVDSRRVYGRDELLVEPISGEGRSWVAVSSVSFPAS